MICDPMTTIRQKNEYSYNLVPDSELYTWTEMLWDSNYTAARWRSQQMLYACMQYVLVW